MNIELIYIIIEFIWFSNFFLISYQDMSVFQWKMEQIEQKAHILKEWISIFLYMNESMKSDEYVERYKKIKLYIKF